MGQRFLDRWFLLTFSCASFWSAFVPMKLTVVVSWLVCLMFVCGLSSVFCVDLFVLFFLWLFSSLGLESGVWSLEFSFSWVSLFSLVCCCLLGCLLACLLVPVHYSSKQAASLGCSMNNSKPWTADSTTSCATLHPKAARIGCYLSSQLCAGQNLFEV